MYEGPADAVFRSAIVDATDRCNLRCKHCFFFREEHDSKELPVDEFVAGLTTLRDRHGIRSMSWSGGEPLFRREAVETGAALFSHNWIFTNGTLPLPDIPNTTVFVSVEGPREIHDRVRGQGVYDRIMASLAKKPVGRPVIFLPTFHKLNAPFLEQSVAELSRIPDAHMGVEFFTPLKHYAQIKGYPHIEIQRSELDLTPEERDDVIDRVMRLKKTHPGFFVFSDRVLELMRSENAPGCVKKCNMARRCLTLDVRLERKLPCVLGRDVDCARCGCIFPYEQQARAEERERAVGSLRS